MMEKKLGRIKHCYFGYGGYQDACIGIYFSLEGSGWGTNWWVGPFAPSHVECDSRCKWTEEDRDKLIVDMVRYVDKLLKEAKVSSVDKLKGIPIEAEFLDCLLKSFRILKEVL